MSPTPTPWRVFQSGSGSWLVTDANGNQIAALSNGDLDRADAELIVKAVNAFDSLKHLFDVAHALVDRNVTYNAHRAVFTFPDHQTAMSRVHDVRQAVSETRKVGVV